MAEFLRQAGVPESDVIIEGNSQNTYENLLEVNKLVGGNPFMLVAQACDLRRAMAVARKLHMNPAPAPACYWALQYHTGISPLKNAARHLEAFMHPSVENLSRIQWAYHEYVGYVWYRLLGRA